MNSEAFAGLHILIAEDDPASRLVLKSYLMQRGCTVSEAGNGYRAVEIFLDERPDLVLLDVMMPQRDGYETATEIKRLSGDRFVPVIFLTALSDGEALEKCVLSGGDDFFTKPYNPDLVAAKMHAMLRIRDLYDTLLETRDALGREVARREKVEEEADRLARYESRTGRPNRRFFGDRLQWSLRRASRLEKQLAVFCVDLDHFGEMQDSFGYEMADGILNEVGTRLASCVQDEEDVAHVGEDMFFLLLEEVSSPDEVAAFADGLLERLSGAMQLNGESTIVSASVGIALFPDDEANEHGLMRAADIAMCRAREEGRARYAFFTRAMHAAVKEKVVMRNGLRNAERRSEFLLHYQPQVDVPSGRVIGVEALLRWSHPGEGILPPRRFLSYIEESDQILTVGGWVLKQACHTHRHWCDNGFPGVRVSVNLSGRQLIQENIVDLVREVIEEEVMDPGDLTIEITERVLSNGSSRILENLSGLRGLGVRMAIDDFGTGYSSLSSLKRFPLDVLKLDRSFVSDLPSNGRGEALIESVIDMAHRLDLEVVAEGVETEEQLQLLSRLGCNQIQGFLFSEPLPQDSFEDLLRRNRA